MHTDFFLLQLGKKNPLEKHGNIEVCNTDFLFQAFTADLSLLSHSIVIIPCFYLILCSHVMPTHTYLLT